MPVLTRRRFLSRGVTLLAAGMSVPAFIAETARQIELRSPFAATAQAAGERIFVLIHLAGGADGLNMLVPYADSAYYSPSNRPSLAIPPPSDHSGNPKVIDINGTVGFHPNMTRLKARFQAGMMACVQGVGYPNPDRSHFRGTDIWNSAYPDRVEPTGWMGRYLLSCGCQVPGTPEAYAVGVTDVPPSFWTDLTLVPAISNLASFIYTSVAGPHNDPFWSNEIATLRNALNQVSSRPEEEFLRQSVLAALSDSDLLQSSVGSFTTVGNYPDTNLGQSAKLTAQLIHANLGSSLYFMLEDGFDTHSNEPNSLTFLVDDLDRTLDAFLVDLEAMGRLDDVVIMTFSEFGRRLAANASLGTDHGVAAPMYLLGSKVNGGLYSTYPSLTDLTLGDLKMTIDFRSVYASVLKDWLNIDPVPILGGSFPTLPLIKTGSSSGSDANRVPLTISSGSAANRMETTIRARGDGSTLRSIAVTQAVNAMVDIGPERGLVQGAVVQLSSNPQSVTVIVNRTTPGQPATAFFTVTDSSGTWPTFAGGGADPWSSVPAQQPAMVPAPAAAPAPGR